MWIDTNPGETPFLAQVLSSDTPPGRPGEGNDCCSSGMVTSGHDQTLHTVLPDVRGIPVQRVGLFGKAGLNTTKLMNKV